MKYRLLLIRTKLLNANAVNMDILLYGASAIFALLTALVAVSSDYRIWGAIAGIAYLIGLGGSLLLKFVLWKNSKHFNPASDHTANIQAGLIRRLVFGQENDQDNQTKEMGDYSDIAYGAQATDILSDSHSGSANSKINISQQVIVSGGIKERKVYLFRYLLLVIVFLTSLVIPLATELVFSANANPGANAQPEVAVIERAGDRLMAGHDLYLSRPTSVGVSPHSDNKSIDSSSYFPYLPTMAVFGIVNASDLPPEFGDARLVLSLFTVLVTLYALKILDISVEDKGRIFQIFLVLPTGALPLVTGGDDLPVLALILLGLAYGYRRQPIAAGIVLGIATTLKFTSWPIAFLLCFVIRDKIGSAGYKKFILSVSAILIPVLLLAMLPDFESFVVNVIRFPLGLSKLSSPAASPLLGQVLVSVFHGQKKAITYMLLGVGVIIVVLMFIKYMPHDISDAAGFASFVMFLATILAPATRFGYLIYPINLFAWSLFADRNKYSVKDKKETTAQSSQLASFIS